MVDKMIVEYADLRKSGIRVLIEERGQGFIDLGVHNFMISFAHEYFGDIVASYLNFETVFFEGEGHCQKQKSQFMIINWLCLSMIVIIWRLVSIESLNLP